MWQASIDDAAGDHAATITVTASASGTSCRLTAQGSRPSKTGLQSKSSKTRVSLFKRGLTPLRGRV